MDINDLIVTPATENPNVITLPLERGFPEVIDNTCRSAFRKCETYWQYQNLYKIKSQAPSIHLHAGAAFAKGIETVRKAYYVDGVNKREALERGVEALVQAYGDFDAPEDSPKGCFRMVEGLINYFDNWQIDQDYLRPYMSDDKETVGIEFSFSLPIEDTDGRPLLHPVTGNPLLYAGRFDMLAVADTDAAGLPASESSLFVEDEKTTSQLGDSWRKQWNLDSQFTGYCWGARSFGLPVAGAIIRGISFLKKGNGFAEAIVYRPQWMIDRWHAEMVRDVKRMIQLYHEGPASVSMALDKSLCGNYGGCTYGLLCESQNPDNWIPMYYERNTWNPLHKED